MRHRGALLLACMLIRRGNSATILLQGRTTGSAGKLSAFATASTLSASTYTRTRLAIMSSSSSAPASADGRPRFVDIGANLLDDMYQGVYRGKARHEADYGAVLQRAWDGGLERIVVTCGSLEESKRGLELARTDARLFCTVGVHPTRCSEFGDNEESVAAHVEALTRVARQGMEDGTVAALGELGLDYARTEFCDIETQKRGFLAQLAIAEETRLPLFIHNRETGDDLVTMLHDNRHRFSRGVVHSFDDSAELAARIIDLDLYIGINGCSLKKPENLEVVRSIPLERLLLETDCPWCDIRASHAGSDYVQTKFPTRNEKKFEMGSCVKGRYEPCHIVQVAEVVAGAKGIDVAEVAEASRKNAYEFFGGLQKEKVDGRSQMDEYK